jgi:hypothetical protein
LYLVVFLLAQIVFFFLPLASPTFAKLTELFIGKAGRTQPVDCFGNSVAAATAVPGGGHLIAHNRIQEGLHDLLTTSNLQCVREPSNIFVNKVSPLMLASYNQEYNNAVTGALQAAIRPDILILNYPVVVDDPSQNIWGRVPCVAPDRLLWRSRENACRPHSCRLWWFW